MILAYIILTIFVIWAQINVVSVMRKYKKVANSSRMTGADLVNWFNKEYGTNIKLKVGNSFLGDYYDPRKDYINLTDDIATVPSLTSIAVAAHELGHALQKHTGALLLKLRSFIASFSMLGSYLGYTLIFLGLIFESYGLALLGLMLFSLMVVFAFVTLPVEIDASKRAIAMLKKHGLITHSEEGPVKDILTAAALTYVAALAVALFDFLRFLYLVLGLRNRD